MNFPFTYGSRDCSQQSTGLTTGFDQDFVRYYISKNSDNMQAKTAEHALPVTLDISEQRETG